MKNSSKAIVQLDCEAHVNSAIKKIVIVGRDADAWLTGLMLKRSFSSSEASVDVELVELPSSLHQHDFFSVLPTHRILHRILGAQENALLRASAGLCCYGQRFSHWAGDSTAFVHAYDRFGVDFEGVNFYQYWLKASANGLKVPLEEFNLGAVAAKQGRHIVFDEITNTFSHASSGYHFNAKTYIGAVARAAVIEGLKHHAGLVDQVSIKDGKIQSLRLADGTEIVADLYIDASGTEAALMSKVESHHQEFNSREFNNHELNNWESWEEYLPVNRLIVASARALEPLPGFSQISAFAEGWFGLHPLLNRTGVNIAYSTKYTNSAAAVKQAAALSGLTISDATESHFAAGMRKKQWIGNCVAIGSSAVSLEPLDATQLHALHVGLSLLRSLFPADKNYMPEADIYNEKMRVTLENVRDFQIGHYHLNKRYGEPFWDKSREAPIPDTLRRKINLFASRGVVAMREDETFFEENWTALFVGQQLRTQHYDPLVNKLDDEELIIKFQQLLGYIKKEVEQMPSLQAHVEMTLL